MALAHHRLALASPEGASRDESHSSLIFKATAFYRQAIDLSLQHLPNLAQKQPAKYIDDAASIILAAYNNIGQLCVDELCDNQSAKGFFDQFSRIVHCDPSFSSAQFRTVGQRLLFSELDWDGFISNLIFLDLMSKTVAAAA
jgi:hypothetical protein